MEIIICPNPERVDDVAAAKAIAIASNVGPSVVLGVATGSSPLGIYARLAAAVRDGTLDLSEAQAFALDEYVGIPVDHPLSYHETIRKTVTVPLGLAPERVHVPNGQAHDQSAAGPEYENLINAAGGVDLQFLGLGANGHIGFNEPTSSLTSRTRIKTLAQKTREDNARFFNSIDDVPRHCITQGLGTILEARAIILVATGASKADAVAAAVEGPLSAFCPGSILQLHQHATVIIDDAAAAKLTLADYYRDIYANLPDWQRAEG